MKTKLIFAAALAALCYACGSDGDRGPDGENGDAGAKGTEGAKGPKGDPGAKGADGDDGTNGTNGTNGAPGADGDDGAPGADGDDGAPGADGNDGAPGTNGTDGDDIILSETARTGLEIAEVALDLTGLNGDEIESLGRGSYLMNAAGDCTGCHNGTGPQGQTLYLAGNVDFPIGGFDAGGAPCTIGNAGCIDSHVFTRNLTPDPTTGLKLSEAQFMEAMRTGRDFKDATGQTSLIVMPWAQLRWLTDQDIKDMYQYLKHIPAVDNPVQADVKPTIPPAPSPFLDNGGVAKVASFTDGAVVRSLPAAFDPVAGKPTTAASEEYDSDNVLRGLAISPLNDTSLVASLSASEQDLYGRGSYIVNGPALCNECHTPGGRNLNGTVRTATFLAGGQAFAVPPPLQPILGQVRTMSGNLTGDNAGFTEPFSVFLNTLVSGLSFTKAGPPHGLGFPMPFQLFRNMTARDKAAVYTYITAIQGRGLITGDAPHQAPARYCTTAVADCVTGETCEAVTIQGVATNECAGAGCTNDGECGACQKCDTAGTMKCLPEDPASLCVTTSF